MKYDFCEFKGKSAAGKAAELIFYGDIVSDSWNAWAREDQYPMNILELLKEIDNSDIDIRINSSGGDVFAGFAIYNMLKSTTGKKTVYIDGVAASIASVIAMAGDEIIMPENSYLMVHHCWTVGMGNADDFRALAETMDKLDAGIVSTYLSQTAEGIGEDKIKRMMDQETWFTASEAAEVFKNIRTEEPLQAAASISGEYAKGFSRIPEGLKRNPDGIPKSSQSSVPKELEKHARFLSTMRAVYGE